MIARLLALLCLILAAALAVTMLRLYSVRAELASHIAADAQAAVAAQLKAKKQTQQLERQHADVLAQAQILAAADRAAAVRAGTELDRLRRTIAARRGDSVPRDPACPAADPAPAEGELLGQCGAALIELARAADGHARDAMTCHAAWPVLVEVTQ